MPTSRKRQPHVIKDHIDHPVIDVDAHWIEPWPVLLDYVATVGGPGAVDSLRRGVEGRASTNNLDFANSWYDATEQDRLAQRLLRGGFWAFPTETLDYATAVLPNLLHERLEELGIDYAVVYPTNQISAMSESREDMRRLLCRAYNVMVSEMFGSHSSSMTPAAVIPTYTPAEAVDELDFVTRELGLKSIVICGHVLRDTVADDVASDDRRTRWNAWLDFLALDSVHDYDPFWAACVEHRVPVTAHGLSHGWPNMASPTSYMFNHIGLFGTANYSFCKALVLGGVPRRFPDLRFAFLESGVPWACQLYADTLEHYSLRNPAALEKHLNPTNLDIDRLRELWAAYSDPAWADKIDELVKSPWAGAARERVSVARLAQRDAGRDEFARMGGPAELRAMFSESFYFGCESEDRTMKFAFDNPLGFDFRPVLGSDIGHWDVAVMAEVMNDAYEMVQDGVLTPEEFKTFVYTNPTSLYRDQNPAFFDGTVLEQQLGSAAPASR